MRTSIIASALTTLLLVASAVAAPVAEAEPLYEVEVIIERDPDLPVHLIEKRQVIVTVTRTAQEQQFKYGQRTRTITRTIRRTRAQTSFTPIATPDVVPDVVPTPDVTPTPTPANTPVQQPQQQQQPATKPKATTSPAADTGSSSSAAVGPDANAQAALDSHNKYRAKHGVGALTWDTTLASYAAQHAGGCVFQHTGGTIQLFLTSVSDK